MKSAVSSSYRTDLQGVRAIAVLMVIISHADLGFLSGGFVGVDIFFVLSGFLITGILVKEYELSSTLRYWRFLANRLKRLLPSLLFLIITVYLCASLLLSNYEFKHQTASGIFASTWTSNLYFAFTQFDYFSTFYDKDLFLHTWSLGVEEQFYLFWPLLIFSSLKILKLVSEKRRVRLHFVCFLISIFILSFCLSIYWSYTNSIWGFYLMPARIWQFTLGALIFLLNKNIQPFSSKEISEEASKKLKLLSGFIGLIMILSSAVLIDINMTYPGYLAIFPAFGAALVILSSSQSNHVGVSALLSKPVLVWIGDRSYALYIWHWPVLILGYSLGYKETYFQVFTLFLITLFLAVFSFNFIEKPFWKGRFSKVETVRCILVSSLLIVVTCSSQLLYSNYQLEKLTNNPRIYDISARTDIPIIYSMECDTWYHSSSLTPCVFKEDSFSKTLVYIGDSVGIQWFSAFQKIFKSPEWRIVVFTKSSCPIVDEDVFYSRIGKIYTVCTDWKKALLESLPTYSPDVIIIGSAISSNLSKEQWIDGSKKIFKRLKEVSSHLIVLTGTPILSFDGPSCVARIKKYQDLLNANTVNQCSEEISNSTSDLVASYIQEAVSDFDSVALLNLNDLVCPEKNCSALTDDGIFVFRDNQHLTDSFVKLQAPIIRERLKVQEFGELISD